MPSRVTTRRLRNISNEFPHDWKLRRKIVKLAHVPKIRVSWYAPQHPRASVATYIPSQPQPWSSRGPWHDLYTSYIIIPEVGQVYNWSTGRPASWDHIGNSWLSWVGTSGADHRRLLQMPQDLNLVQHIVQPHTSPTVNPKVLQTLTRLRAGETEFIQWELWTVLSAVMSLSIWPGW